MKDGRVIVRGRNTSSVSVSKCRPKQGTVSLKKTSNGADWLNARKPPAFPLSEKGGHRGLAFRENIEHRH